MALLIIFGVPHIDSDQGIHFSFQNTQCWALEQNIQQNIYLSYWSQAAGAIIAYINKSKLS